VLACALALALAACGPAARMAAPATSAATLAGTAPAQPASSHPTRAPSTSGPHSAPRRSSLPSVHPAPPSRTSTSAAIHADHVVGDGTPGSCTSAAVVQAVAAGGVIAFSCGP